MMKRSAINKLARTGAQQKMGTVSDLLIPVPMVRLHDCNWPHPNVLDIPVIFRLFHLDADDPRNYRFAKTDGTPGHLPGT